MFGNADLKKLRGLSAPGPVVLSLYWCSEDIAQRGRPLRPCPPSSRYRPPGASAPIRVP